MSPKATAVMDVLLEMLDGKLDAEELGDVAFSLLGVALHEMTPAEREHVLATLPDKLARWLAGYALVSPPKAGQQRTSECRVLH
jgi:hypothetical protein